MSATGDLCLEVSKIVDQNPDQNYSLLMESSIMAATRDLSSEVSKIIEQKPIWNYSFLM
jgi:hypothetical protein